MSRSVSTVFAITTLAMGALAMGGCSLVWGPVYPDAAPVDAAEMDAPVDAFSEPDGGLDAYIVPDAYAPPPEECERIGDEDMDDFADCSDPDCYGHPACCSATAGSDESYDALFSGTTRPLEWSSRAVTLSAIGDSTRLGAAGPTTGSLWRELCFPLGQGGRFRFRLEGRSEAGSGNTLSIVLSPAPEPGPTGFLDELALHVGEGNRLTATRAGSSVALAGACVSDGSAQLGTTTTFELTLLPGVADDSSALLATLTVTSNGGCTETTTLFEDEAILVSDLRRTLDASRSCQDSPGLWFALDVRGAGAFAVSPLGGAEAEIEMRPLECASPGVFTRSTVVLDRESVQAGSAMYTSGGIGAPDLTAVGAQWALAYDASLEDRSEEIFRPLTLSLGVARGAAADSSTFTPTSAGAVTVTGARSREPSLSSVGGRTFLVWSREMATMRGHYELIEGLFDSSTGTTTASTLLNPADDCDSLREASTAAAFDSTGINDGDWIFARCDVGAMSRLAMWRRVGSTAPNLRESNLLGGDPIADRVIAADVFAVRRSARQTFGLWVLARGPTDEAELHLYLADQVVAGVMPRFFGYAGNPVLTEADGSLPACPAGDTCRLTSVSVAPVFRSGLPDDIRFLFARSRTGATTTYEIVAAEQRALSTLDE